MLNRIYYIVHFLMCIRGVNQAETMFTCRIASRKQATNSLPPPYLYFLGVLL